jgi:hypothetical protein
MGLVLVELTTFTAIGNGSEVVLNWQTATEVNNYGFEVERCIAQISNLCHNWETIGFVEGHGNSNSPKDYSFTDTWTPLSASAIKYRLKQIDSDGKYEYSDVVEIQLESPKEYMLSQNYPNPFNPSTTIKYSIPVNLQSEISDVKLVVYDILGKEIATLVNTKQSAGNHEVEFNASNLPSGVYIYSFQSGEFVSSKKMILIK